MYYEINVAKLNKETCRYEHYFATSERSIPTLSCLQRVLRDFIVRFPEKEGFRISAEQWEKRGNVINIYTLLKED